MQFLLVNLLLSTATAAAVETSCLPIEKDCSYYTRCVESVIPCGSTGYSLNYGGRYCQAFKDNASNFSPAGQRWIWKVMNCLQTQLVPFVENNKSATCPQLKTFAYNTHPGCYTAEDHDICDIPPSDWVKLLAIVKRELLDFETVKLATQVARHCVVDIFDFSKD